jgi:hypothetical protein
LTEIDLSPFSNITEIWDGFLCHCKSLKEIDLSPLSKLESIGDNFCYRDIKKIKCTQVQKDILLTNNSDLANKITLI